MSGRLENLPTLPVFFKLRDRRVLLAGGGEPAVWKAELLCAAGARVAVVGTDICSALEDLATELGPEALHLQHRPWVDADFTDAAMALGAIEVDDEAERFAAAAHRAGVPVNVIDKPAFCDFQFGTLVVRSPLVLAITTDGAAPVFGQALRARLEAWMPEGLRAWAQAAKDWRPAVQDRGWSFRNRRRFWEVFADRALEEADRPPTEADRAACFDAVEAEAAHQGGSVTLVGSGPGRTECLTFAAARRLQTAEVLLYDAEVPAVVVGLGRREAEKRLVASEEAGTAMALAEASHGRRVIWLGSGNPATCIRWQERNRTLLAAGIPCTVEAGLSSCPRCARQCGVALAAPEASSM
ncbi:NAD(P)-dependent oxidoreductase [Lichenihabitans sp. Uapishka_5]|uniref:siroheme synthase n=1 Tax=Lichenihabitans sp. Uapishka_5 TaxID=3037302 RepID=UPI0029E7E22E|nr:NAD(P)-dependent oxidoreductase [Lichenihabitans sp. Uapishka_5]MDX7952737.1 NAD(P)-dependent oxidoreductase [Lichenihabitans sp. Uapishka_5]